MVYRWSARRVLGRAYLAGAEEVGIEIRQAVTMIWFWINTTYACGGVATDEDGIVRQTCPIYRWMLKQPLNDCIKYLRRKGQFREWKRLTS